jgi:hypothetical protein
VEGFDGNAGYKNFSEDNRYITHNLGQFWQRRIVFSTAAQIPHHQISPRGSGSPTHWCIPAPARLDDDVNSHIINLLFGQCRGPNTAIRVRDLLDSPVSAPGVTLLEPPQKLNVQGKAGSTVMTWPRNNSFTPTKKAARMKFKARENGAFGPELFELSNAHVYVLTVFVAGYRVLGCPVPGPSLADRKTSGASDDSEMVDLSNALNASMKDGKGEPSSKKIKVEPGTEEEAPIILAPPNNIAKGTEASNLLAIEQKKKKIEGGELFEVSITSVLRMYIYKKFV